MTERTQQRRPRHDRRRGKIIENPVASARNRHGSNDCKQLAAATRQQVIFGRAAGFTSPANLLKFIAENGHLTRYSEHKDTFTASSN